MLFRFITQAEMRKLSPRETVELEDDKFEEMLVKRGKFKKSITGGFESKEEGLEGITLHHHSGDTCLWEDAEE